MEVSIKLLHTVCVRPQKHFVRALNALHNCVHFHVSKDFQQTWKVGFNADTAVT